MWECVGCSLPARGFIEGPCHLLSLVSFHRLLSPLLFSFGPWLPSQAAQENSKFLFILYAEQFGSHIVLLSLSKRGPFTLRGHQDIFLNKEPAYVHWRMESFLDWGCSCGLLVLGLQNLALLCSRWKLTGILTFISSADKDSNLTTFWSLKPEVVLGFWYLKDIIEIFWIKFKL